MFRSQKFEIGEPVKIDTWGRRGYTGVVMYTHRILGFRVYTVQMTQVVLGSNMGTFMPYQLKKTGRLSLRNPNQQSIPQPEFDLATGPICPNCNKTTWSHDSQARKYCHDQLSGFVR